MSESLKDLIAAEEKKQKVDIPVHEWLQDKLGTIGSKNIRVVTHIGKYTHPDANVQISINPNNTPVIKGYLCSSGFDTKYQDYLCSAEFIPYVKTLEAVMKDGRQIREHLREGSTLLKNVAQVDDATLETWRQSYFEKLKDAEHCTLTEKRIKQVYFPLENGEYRLMSLIPCSVLIWELKERISAREWQVETTGTKEKSVRIAYIEKWERKFGGTKPQNISFLNSQNGGRAKILPCLPPSLSQKFQLPLRDFISQFRVFRPQHPNAARNSLWPLFEALHDTLVHDPNTEWARKKKRGIIRSIVEQGIIRHAEHIRHNASAGWSLESKHSGLDSAQKIWLDPEAAHPPEIAATDWPKSISRQIALLLLSNLETVIKFSKLEQITVRDEAFLDEISSIAREYIDG